MPEFPREVVEAARSARQVTLTTLGRKSGKRRRVTIWIASEGDSLFVRSGGGMVRDWPQNLEDRGEAELKVGGHVARVRPRRIDQADEARAVSQLYRAKYGFSVKPSKPSEPLTKGETATFELLPAD